MAKKCCIKNCRTNFEKNSIYISFFNFPRSDAMRKVWESALNVTPDDKTLVCSRHFPDHHMQLIRGQTILKRHAKPELDLKPARPARKKKKFGMKRKPQCKQQCSTCLVCSQPVTFLYEFLTDAHTHRTLISKRFLCGHCLQEFTTYSSLMGHITGIGSDLKFTPNNEKTVRLPPTIPRRQYPCSHCSAVFETSVARLYHEVTHTAATQEDLCQALKINPRTMSATPTKDVQKDKLKKRPRPVKILAEDPSEICLNNVLEPAPPSEVTVKVVATSETSPDKPLKPVVSKRRVKILAPDPSEICLDVPPAQKRPEVVAKKCNNENSLSGKRQLNSISSLPAHQKRRLLSSVYCNCCELQFPTLKLLDKHYWSHHSNLDIPLDLAFEVGSGDVAPAATLCSACAKRTACVNTLSRLLEETARDSET